MWTGSRPIKSCCRAWKYSGCPGGSVFSSIMPSVGFGGLAWKRNKWDREAGFIRVDPDVAMDQPKVTEGFERPSMMKRAIERMASRPKENEPLGDREAVE